MNVLTLGSRVIGPEPGFECAVAFLGATFSGEPRHRRRLGKVLAIEAAAAGDPADSWPCLGCPAARCGQATAPVFDP